jgi:hypothetical protein
MVTKDVSVTALFTSTIVIWWSVVVVVVVLSKLSSICPELALEPDA